MCDPITLGLMAAGTVASVVGGGMQAKEAVKANGREVAARNRVLQETLRRNDQQSQASREAFQRRVSESEAAPAQQQLAQSQGQAEQTIAGNLATTGTEAPLAGDAPKVVRDTMKSSLGDSFRKSLEQAKRQGALTGYDMAGRDAAISDAGLGREINTNNNFVRGNMSIMPHLQDFAAYQAYKPSSGLGQIIASLGGMATQAAGARGGASKAAAPRPMHG